MDLLQTPILIRTNYSSNPMSIRDAKGSSAFLMGKRRLDNPSFSYFGTRNYWKNDYLDKYHGYQSHEYDLYEYARIIDTEAMVAKAFERKRSLIFKNGYFFESDNDDNVKYIKERIRQIEYVTGSSFRSFIEELAYNLVMFHNAYIVLVRDEKRSLGKPYNDGTKELEPIAGWFNLPTESIQRKIKPNGDIASYRQYIDANNQRIFKPEKIRHLKYNARTGFTIGTPPLEAVKDDILALRRIEESVETLIYKGIFPMIHVKVGTEDKPAQKFPDGTDEVQQMNIIMEQLDDYGGVTTNERVEIKAIGAESLALRVESYLEYFKDRVMLGLGVSDIDMGIGDSSGKATGQIISQTLKEAVINMQDAISDFITNTLFTPLLVESGRYKADYEIEEEDIVKFKFNHVDQDAQIKIESHILNMFNSGLLKFNEARKEIGYKELEESDIKSVGQEKEDITPKYQVDASKTSEEVSKISAKAVASAKAQQGKANSSGNKTKAQGSAKASASKTNPKNQYRDSLEDNVHIELSELSDSKDCLYAIIADHIKSVIDTSNRDIDNMVDKVALLGAEQIYSIRDKEGYVSEDVALGILVDLYAILEDIV